MFTLIYALLTENKNTGVLTLGNFSSLEGNFDDEGDAIVSFCDFLREGDLTIPARVERNAFGRCVVVGDTQNEVMYKITISDLAD